MRIRFVPVICTFVFGSGFCTASARQRVYLHREFKSGERLIRTIAVLPARVSLTKFTVWHGNEPMVTESVPVAEKLKEFVSGALQDKYRVEKSAFAKPIGPADTEPMYSAANLWMRFETIIPRLLKKPKDLQKGRYSLGSEVDALAAGISADGLVFVRAEGREVVTGWFDTICKVVLVDLKTGDVLALVEAFGVLKKPGTEGPFKVLHLFSTDPEAKFRKQLSESFRNLPR